jgi:hypothetical protein
MEQPVPWLLERRPETMFRQILFLNWKASRYGLLPLVMVAFGLPFLAVKGARLGQMLPNTDLLRGTTILHGVAVWAHLFPVLAWVLGAVLALLIWNWDHRGDHVYPLALPLPRWKYVLMKMGAGGVLLLVPVLTLWMGSLISVSLVEIPEGLRAYPTALSFRFLLSALICFALFFALAAGTMRTAVALLVAWILLIFLGEVLPPFLGRMWGMPGLADFRFLRWFLDTAMSWPGPFEVLTGNWMIIDV